MAETELNNTNKELNEDEKKMFITCLHTEMPRVIERTGLRWIEFGDPRYGRFNLFPQDLIDLKNSSPTHGQIIERKANMMAGKAINYSKDMTVADQAAIAQFILRPNPYMDLHTLVKRMAMDYCIFGAFALSVIWSKDRKKINQINHIDVSTLRANPRDRFKEIPGWWYSEDWNRYRSGTPQNPGEFEPVYIPSFGYGNCPSPKCDNYTQDVYGDECPLCGKALTPANTGNEQILYVGKYTPGHRYYATPDYIAARSWIELDAEMGLMHLSSVLNGMNPSFILNFIGKPSPEEKTRQWRDIKANFVGPRKSGQVMCLWNETKDLVPTMTPIDRNTNIDKLYIVLAEQAQSQIMTSHSVTSTMLFGIQTPGRLGGKDEIKESYNIFDRDVITPAQIEMSKVLNRICAINGLKPSLYIDKNSPIEFTFTEDLLAQVMTINELRKQISLPDLTPEEYTDLLGVITGKKPTTGQPEGSAPPPQGTGAGDGLLN